MILIPSTGREEPETEKMSEMDQEMSSVLKNSKLSVKEKVELYNEILRRNIVFENRLMQKPQVTDDKSVTNTFPEVKQEQSIPTKSEDDNDEEKLFDISLSQPLKRFNNYSNLKTPIFTGTDLSLMNTFDWDDIDDLTLSRNLREKTHINYEESPSSLLNSEKKKKAEKKKRYKLNKKSRSFNVAS